MTRTITYCGTLWTLRRDGRTARADIMEIDDVGVELRYTRNHKPFLQCIYTDGAELLREDIMENDDIRLDLHLNVSFVAWTPMVMASAPPVLRQCLWCASALATLEHRAPIGRHGGQDNLLPPTLVEAPPSGSPPLFDN